VIVAEFRLPDVPATWVMTGDSITQGVYHTHGGRSWVEHLHERIRWQLDRLTDLVINSGVSGWTAPLVLDEFDHLVGRFDPAVVSISLGTNDANDGLAGLPVFESAMTQLVERAQRLGAQVILQTPALVTAGAVRRAASLSSYAETVRKLAVHTGSILVDHERHWAQRFGEKEPIEWLDDHSHPNTAGHLQMANLLLQTLGLGEMRDRP
jgi:lysophospholipase L1-like esterase